MECLHIEVVGSLYRKSNSLTMAVTSSTLFLLLLHLLTFLTTPAPSKPEHLLNYCSTTDNYTDGSTYKTNLDNLLSSLTATTPMASGFYSSSAGDDPDKANAIALCRGDISDRDCIVCLANATLKLPQVCPNNREAIGWYDFCMLRYSDKIIYGATEISSLAYAYAFNIANVSDVNTFNQALMPLLDSLRAKAASGGSDFKFATGETAGPGFGSIYGLVQCTPDLLITGCNTCLSQAIQNVRTCCDGKQGARVFKPSCNLRYQIYPFYTPSAPPPAPSPPPPPAPPPASKFLHLPPLATLTFHARKNIPAFCI